MARRNAHFRRRFNASGPLERVLILIVLAAAIGVTIGLLLPQVSSDAAKITGGYTATGSAADTLNALAVDDNQSSSGYDRDSFGFRTTDVDGNGCDVRDDVLARDLTDITYKYAGSCVVESGTLADPYTAQTIHFVRGRATSAKVQIDHVVALNDAWASGLWKNSRKNDRVKYANDPDVLLASQGDANNAKSEGINLYGSGVPKKSVGRWAASTPSVWLPSNSGYQCSYMAKRVYIKDKYGLSMSSWEKSETIGFLEQCQTAGE